MGQLSASRFKDKYTASGGPYKGKDYVSIFECKVRDKKEFILGQNANGRKVYGLKLLKDDKGKYTIVYSNSKSGRTETGRDLVSKFFKDPDFGGGKGSGGGASDTAITESLQCYFLSILFNTGATKLTNQNTDIKALKKQHDYCFTYDKSQRNKIEDLYEKCPEDWFKTDVFIKSANAIYNSQYVKVFKNKKVYFHRGSPFMKAVYDNKKKAQDYDKKVNNPPIAPGSFNDDKWNPGDIWMSTKQPTSKLPFSKDEKTLPVEWTELREAVRDKVDEHTLGISLKKVGGSQATVTPFNTRKRTHNADTKFAGFTFGQTGDFFNSADVYLHFSDGGQMQLRAMETIKSWQGEMKGKYAAAGKIGGGVVNHYVEKNFNRTIGHRSNQSTYRETYYKEINLDNFYNLYIRFINKQKPGTNKQDVVAKDIFKKNADEYTQRGQNKSKAFYFGKYMGLLFLEAVEADRKGKKLDEFSRQIVRYAMSNTDISTFFLKVS